MQEVKRYTIYIPSGLHQNLKVYVAKKETSISAVIIGLLTKFLNEDDDRYVPTLNDTITGVKP